jgi:hypothetical protein
VGGRELTWGEGVEEVLVLKRASHAFPSAGDEPTLCAEAPPFVPQSLVVGGGAASSGRGAALARALSGDSGGAPGEAKQRPLPYFVSAAGGCYCRNLLGGLTGLVCQVYKLRQQQRSSYSTRSGQCRREYCGDYHNDSGCYR